MTVQPAVGGKRTERPGFLLDLISDAETDQDSVQRLADSSAVAMSRSAGAALDAAAVLTRTGTPPAIAGSGTAAYNLAASDDRYHDGPLAHSAASEAPVQVAATSVSQRWEAYRCRLSAAGYGAALAVPLELDPRTSCTVVFLGPEGFHFAPELVDEAAWFAAMASQSMKLALEVRSVRSAGDNLKAMLESRTSIDVACGVIMAQNRCSYTEAFGKLAGVSRQRNLKVRSVAENVLKAMPSGSPSARFEPPALA